MSNVIYLALLLLIALLGCYMVIENNRRKAIQAEKKRINTRIKEINDHFKQYLISLNHDKLIRPKHIAPLNAICSNFFVVQAHNNENLNKLETVCNLFINTIDNEQMQVQSEQEQNNLIDKLRYFTAELPHAGIGYNKAFYHEIYPSLIKSLTYNGPLATIEIVQATDNKSNQEAIVES